MALSAQAVRTEYNRIAPLYAVLAAVGFPVRGHLYRQVLPRLALRGGETVLDLCCGTGLNFPHLIERIGPTGRLIGLDLTEGMLEQARARVAAHGWTNVELIQGDASHLDTLVHTPLDVVFCSLAFCLVPDKPRALRAVRDRLKPGGRLVIIDAKPFEGLGRLLNPAYRWFMSFAPSNLVLFREHPWEQIRAVFPEMEFRTYYSGCTYVAITRQST